jgi:hypothetical protein
MTDEAITQPTIQTLLERMDAQTAEMRKGFAALEESLTVRLDRIDSMVHATRADMLAIRADFSELRGQLRELIPALK